MTRNMVDVEISDFFDQRQPRYDHSKNDLKYTPSGAILEWFWGGAPAAPREGLGSNSIWLWTYPMGTWSPMIPKQSYQIWPFPATVWGTHGSRLKVKLILLCTFIRYLRPRGMPKAAIFTTPKTIVQFTFEYQALEKGNKATFST